MKFSCDDCGAQYMIADDKVGPRGVKVRCKKCAHVIILKHDGVSSGSNGSIGIPSMSVPPPPPQDEETVSAEGGAAAAAQSSDFGLSAEFAAAGFDSSFEGFDEPTREEQVSVSSGGGYESRPSSPFEAPAGGGSLADELDGLGAAGLSGDLDDEANDDPTRVEALPDDLASALRDEAGVDDQDESNDEEMETRVGGVPDLGSFGASGGSDDLFGDGPLGGAAISDDLDGPPTALGATLGDDDSGLSDEGGFSAKEQSLPPPPPPADEDDDFGAGFGGSDDGEDMTVSADAGDNEMFGSSSSSLFDDGDAPDLGASTDDDYGRSDDLGRDDDALAAREDSGLSDTQDEEVDGGGLGSLADLAAAVTGDLDSLGSLAPRSEPPMPSIMSDTAGLSSAARGEQEMVTAVAGMDGVVLEEEIGSALDAVFGDPGAEGGAFGGLMAEARSSESSSMDSGYAPSAETDDGPEAIVAPAQETPREWYVAIDDEQVGPLNQEEVRTRFSSGDIDENSLCWKQGMDDWIAIRFVSEFEDLEAPRPAAAAVSSGAAMPMAAAGGFGGGAGLGASVEEEPAPSAGLFGPDDDEDEESSWKPSAASALASLAAAEVDEEAPVDDVAAGPAFPASITGGSSSLDSLLDDPQPRSASLFGAGEATGRISLAPLPKAPELQSSVSLADPVVGTRRIPGWLPPTAAILIVGLIGIFVLGDKDPPPQAPPPPVQQQVATNLQPQQAAPTPPPVEETKAAEEEPKEDTKAEESEPEQEAKASKSSSKKKRKKRGRKSRSKKRAAPEPTPEPAKSNAPVGSEDDLLSVAGAPSGGSKPKSSLPESLDDGQIFGVLRKNKSAIKRCLDKQAKADPRVQGVMTVKMVIQKNGRTSKHDVSPSKFKNTVVGKCVVASVRRWQFDKFAGRPIPLDFPVRVGG